MPRGSNSFESVAYKTCAIIYEQGRKTAECEVGDVVWFASLDVIVKFSYAPFSHWNSYGKVHMTCRKEKRGNAVFWYAYAKVNGKTKKKYIGKKDAVTNDRLREVYLSLVVSAPR